MGQSLPYEMMLLRFLVNVDIEVKVDEPNI